MKYQYQLSGIGQHNTAEQHVIITNISSVIGTITSKSFTDYSV